MLVDLGVAVDAGVVVAGAKRLVVRLVMTMLQTAQQRSEIEDQLLETS